MLKIPRIHSSIRAGFIGVVLIILVIAVGLAARTAAAMGHIACSTRRCSPRRAASASATTSRCRGSRSARSSGVSLDNGDALVRFTIAGQYALGSETTAHIRTGSLLGQRVLTLESAGSGTSIRDTSIPIDANVVAVFADRRGQRAHDQHRRHRHRQLNQSLDTLSATLDQIAPQLGPTFDGLSRLSTVAQQPQREPGRSAEDRRRCHRDPVRTQPAGQHAHPQRQRSARGPQRTPAGDRRACSPTPSAVSQATVGSGRRQREEAGADAGEAERGQRRCWRRTATTSPRRCPARRNTRLTQSEIVASGAYYNAYVPNLLTRRRFCSRSSTTRSGSGAVHRCRPAAGQRRARGPNFRSPSTAFRSQETRDDPPR